MRDSRLGMLGSMDMGGASTQIAYGPTAANPLSNTFSVKIQDEIFNVYATSFLKYGNDQFRELVFESIMDGVKNKTGNKTDPFPNPCQSLNFIESGRINATKDKYFIGTGDWDACKAITDLLMYPDTPCLFESDSECGLNGKYMPPITRNDFVAINDFYYTALGLGLTGGQDSVNLHLQDFEDAGKAWCAKAYNPSNWSDFSSDYCRNSVYIVSLLHGAYHIGIQDETVTVTYASKVFGHSVDWALGAAIYYEEAFRTLYCGNDAQIVGDTCVSDQVWTHHKTLLGAGVGIGMAIVVVLIILGYAGLKVYQRRRETTGDGVFAGETSIGDYEAM